MRNSQIKGMAYEERLDLSATAKIICKNQNVTSHHLKPSKRYGHLSFIYKGKLYVQGGCTNQGKLQINSSQQNKASIYCISLDKQRMFFADEKKLKKGPEISDYKWQKLTCKFSPVANNQFQNLSYAAYCIFPNKKRLYTFGGTSAQGKTSNCLFRLDLDDFEWSKPEQKGVVPKGRQDASLHHYVKNDKNYLVLYGGANFETYQIFSDLHFYQIQTKFWFQCHNLASNFIQPRLSPAVAFNQNKIYLFGGYYIDAQMKRGYLNDLYQIQFNLTVEKGKPYGRSFSKRLDQINCFMGYQQSSKPQKRCSASLIFFKSDFFQAASLSTNKKNVSSISNCLALIGGEKTIEDKRRIVTNSDFWLFSFGETKWKYIPLVNQFRPRSSFSAVYDRQLNKFFIFGGLSSMQTVLNDLVSIKLNCKPVENISIKNKNSIIPQKIRPAINFDGLMIQELSNNINFPFSAIGMITENFINFQATFCDISYHISKNHPVAQNYIKFQSNAKFLMSRQAIISHFLHLKGGVRSYVQGTDKKIKTQMNKQNLAKQIGSNFILAGLRLGNQIVFVNLNEETYNIQIVVILKCGGITYGQIKGQQQQDSFKSFKLFQFLIEKDQILTEDVFSTHRLNSEYKQRRFFLQQVLSQESRERLKILIVQAINSIKKGQVKNLFYISKLKTLQGEECTMETKQTQLQLFPDMLNNDIVYGDRQLIKELQMSKVPVYESLDVSLKTYMSYLYLQCQTQFTVSIHGLQRKPIYVQEYLMKIDQLLKSKDVVEVSNDFQCDCKIRQLYYFSNKGSSNSFNNKLDRNEVKLFVNGILYYQKSRLIGRHQVPLGQFIYHYKIKEITQYEESKRKKTPKVHNNYFTQVFGHIQLPESVPLNSTKTDFLFDVMLEKTQAKLMIFDEKIKLQKQGRIIQKKQKR